ncbi:MAG TPA: FG-GAP-like repeat-containing protein, partial [Chryseolinea sp.]|nr:FG-GAP-like repeat-containing protein [Chryseolinea sp.]
MKSLYRLAFLLSISIYSFGQIPAVSDFTPTSGPVGTSVIISGSNFSTTSSDNIVYFGSVKANVTNALSNELTVTVPHGATYQPISVTVNGLTAYSSKIFITTFQDGGFIDPSSFGSPISFTPAEFPNKVAIGDLDGDGKSDVAVVVVDNQTNQTLSVFRNVSTVNLISFAPGVDFPLGKNGSDIAIGDLDGDGKLDIVVTSEPMHNVSILRNICTPGSITSASFEPKVTFATAQFPFDVSIEDLDLDGKPDLVVATEFSKISVLRNTSTIGSMTTASFASAIHFNVGTESLCVSAGDLDGDGKPELVASSADGNTISILRNTASPGSITAGSFSAKVDFATGSYPAGIAIADLDGDNKSDIAVTNNTSNSISVFKNVSVPGSITTSSLSEKVDFPTGNYPYFIVAADIDGDGKPDLCINGEHALSVFRNVSTQGMLSASSFEPKVDVGNDFTNYSRASIGDMDNNGKPDLTYIGLNKINILPNVIGPSILPIITSFTPSSGLAGSTVVISGANFGPLPSNNVVAFNGTNAVVTGSTPTSITVIVPSNATSGFISVSVYGHTVTSTSVFTIIQNQSISFNSIASTKTLGDLPFTLDATASSGLPVQFSTSSTKISLSGNQVTLLMPGSVTVTANQSGNDEFTAASPVSQTF